MSSRPSEPLSGPTTRSKRRAAEHFAASKEALGYPRKTPAKSNYIKRSGPYGYGR